MFLSRTNTAPTLARLQVERSATWRVMSMKYWSHDGRSFIALGPAVSSTAKPDRRRNELVGLRTGPPLHGGDRHGYERGNEQQQREPTGDAATRIEVRQ